MAFISIRITSSLGLSLFQGYVIARMNRSLFSKACCPFFILDLSKIVLNRSYLIHKWYMSQSGFIKQRGCTKCSSYDLVWPITSSGSHGDSRDPLQAHIAKWNLWNKCPSYSKSEKLALRKEIKSFFSGWWHTVAVIW